MNIDQMVEALDEKTSDSNEKWDLYRLMTGGWGIRLEAYHGDPLSRTVTAESIGAVLNVALEAKRIPTVPRRPSETSVDNFRARKLGNGRWISEDKRGLAAPHFGVLKTKKAVMEALDNYVNYCNSLAEAWDEEWSELVNNGTRGVDYVMYDEIGRLM